MSNIYAANPYTIRNELWDNLSAVNDSMMKVPWILIGEYNVILSSEERSECAQGLRL